MDCQALGLVETCRFYGERLTSFWNRPCTVRCNYRSLPKPTFLIGLSQLNVRHGHPGGVAAFLTLYKISWRLVIGSCTRFGTSAMPPPPPWDLILGVSLHRCGREWGNFASLNAQVSWSVPRLILGPCSVVAALVCFFAGM